MMDGRHFGKKSFKAPYLRNCVADFDEPFLMKIGTVTHWPHSANQTLEFGNLCGHMRHRAKFKPTERHLENHKNCNISPVA